MIREVNISLDELKSHLDHYNGNRIFNIKDQAGNTLHKNGELTSDELDFILEDNAPGSLLVGSYRKHGTKKNGETNFRLEEKFRINLESMSGPDDAVIVDDEDPAPDEPRTSTLQPPPSPQAQNKKSGGDFVPDPKLTEGWAEGYAGYEIIRLTNELNLRNQELLTTRNEIDRLKTEINKKDLEIINTDHTTKLNGIQTAAERKINWNQFMNGPAMTKLIEVAGPDTVKVLGKVFDMVPGMLGSIPGAGTAAQGNVFTFFDWYQKQNDEVKITIQAILEKLDRGETVSEEDVQNLYAAIQGQQQSPPASSGPEEESPEDMGGAQLTVSGY